MIDLEKRAKAWDEFSGEAREFTIGDTFNSAYELGVRDGAASVDRRAIVEEAFKRFKWKYASRDKNGHFPSQQEAMDAVLAEMGVKDE